MNASKRKIKAAPLEGVFCSDFEHFSDFGHLFFFGFLSGVKTTVWVHVKAGKIPRDNRSVYLIKKAHFNHDL